MSTDDLTRDERRRLQTAEQTIARFEAVIARCEIKIAGTDVRREKLERKIIDMRREIERVRRVQAIAKGG